MSAARIAVMLPKLSAYGGAERFAMDLSGALSRAGYVVDFICARREAEPPEGVRPVVVGRPPLVRSAKVAWFAHAAEKARKDGAYDLSISMGKTVRQDVLRASGGPLSIFWELSSRAYAEGLPRAFKMLRRRMSPANAIIRSLERKSLLDSKVVITVSHLVRDWLIKAHPELESRELSVIYNRPDLSRFSPPEPGRRQALRNRFDIDPGRIALSFAGTNFMLKGLPTLLAAMSMLPDEFELLVAGGRNPGRFMNMARELGLAGRVRFLGRVEDMPDLYRASDVFVLPSFYDTCSNAVLEALACGTPAVSSTLNGSSVFLDQDRVIPPGDPAALARAVENAASTPRPGPFAWPNDVPCGIPPYLDLVCKLLDG